MDKNDNLSVVLMKKGDIQIKQTPIPSKIDADEVLLQTKCVGICGSDVHYWEHGGIGIFVVKAPMILGHETSAVVLKVGEKVKNLKPGDRVAVEPGVPCRYCDLCKEGLYNLCTDVKFFATPPIDGTLTRFFKHPGDFCFKLPDNMSFEEGALLEPLSVAVHACNRGNITVGDNVLICGAGPIGLMSMLTAKAYGVSATCVTDINEERLKFAKSLGATHTILLRRNEQPEETAKKVIELIGKQPNKTLECSGAASSYKLAILATKSAGKIVLVGMGSDEVTIPILSATQREIDFIGLIRYRNCYPKALDLVSSGRVNVKPFVTHRYKLEDSVKAFEKARSGEAVKVMIDCSK